MKPDSIFKQRHLKGLIHIVLLLHGSFITTLVIGQTNRSPANGEMGIPGSVSNSFLISWSPESGVVDYEYVLSNNRLCFESCPGDTRQSTTNGDTLTIEYDLIPERWYYWIYRKIYTNGTTSEWSSIYNFFTQTPEVSSPILVVAPNPVEDKTLRLKIDWAVNLNAPNLDVSLFNLQGTQVLQTYTIERSVQRFQFETLNLFGIAAGYYLLLVEVSVEDNEAIDQFTLKLIIE